MDQLEQRLYKNYYSQLTAEQLLLAVTDECFITQPAKPGPWRYHYLKTDPLIIDGVEVSGLVWRDQKTGRERPELKEEHQAIAEELYLTEGKLSQPFRDSILKGLTRYVQYRPLIVKRINELALPVLYGQREDVQVLVNEYQAGNKDILPRIKNQLGGIIYKAEKQFRGKYTGEKVEVFTNLAGKINKKLKKPERIYSEKSPAGGGEDPRLFLTMEPFKFTEADINALVVKTLMEALDSYRFAAGAKFKTWFYRLFYDGLQDLYREYQHGWIYGHVIKDIEELEEELQNRIIPRLEHATVAEYLLPSFMDKMTLGQKEWTALFLKMLPDSLTSKLTAEKLGSFLKTAEANERQEHRTRKNLQKLIISEGEVFKRSKYRKIEVRDKQKGLRVTKWPAFTDTQKKMKAHYKNFVKDGPVFTYNQQAGQGPEYSAYKPGICKGSFFPITGPFARQSESRKMPYIRPLPPVKERAEARRGFSLSLKYRKDFTISRNIKIWTFTGECGFRLKKIIRHYYNSGHLLRIKFNESEFKTIYGPIDIIEIKRRELDQKIKPSKKYCSCCRMLTITGECMGLWDHGKYVKYGIMSAFYE